MFKKTTTRLLAIGLAMGLSFAGLTACDAPEQAESPLAEAPEPSGEQVQIGEPEAPGQAEAPGQPGQAEAPERPAPGEAPGAPGEAQQPPQMAQPGGQMEEVDDSTLDEFAEAFTEVQKVQSELQAELQAVESPEEAQAVQQEVVAKIQEKVESTGMEFQEYMMLAQRLERDPELQQRLEQRMQ